MTNVIDEAQTVEEEVTEEEHDTATDTTEDSEATEEQEASEDASETVTIPKRDFDRLKASLAKKARLESKAKGKDDTQESTQGYDQDLIARTFLAAQAGVTDRDVQDEALRLANKFDMKIDQAMQDPDISTRLKNLQKQKQIQSGIAGNGGVNTGKPKSIDQYTAEFNKTGKLPDDPRIVSQILDQLTKK
jgi:actin-related protein